MFEATKPSKSTEWGGCRFRTRQRTRPGPSDCSGNSLDLPGLRRPLAWKHSINATFGVRKVSQLDFWREKISQLDSGRAKTSASAMGGGGRMVHTVESTVSLAQDCGRNMTTLAPHKALKIIAGGKLTFDEMVALHHVVRVSGSTRHQERWMWDLGCGDHGFGSGA